MIPTGKGTNAENRKIRYLISGDRLKMNKLYYNSWASMFKAVFDDVESHCTMLAKTLKKSKVPGLRDLEVPVAPPLDECHPTIPVVAFVVTKLFKTFDTKMEKESNRSLNGSHATNWVRHIKDLYKNLDEEDDKKYSFLSKASHYDELTDNVVDRLNNLAYNCAGSRNGDFGGSSDGVDV